MSAPERLDRFMARANAAYYAARDPFADFTTAPEICQAFGEVLGVWAAVTWDRLGRPAPVVLAEAGPGRGTLMRDALRAIGSAMPPFRDALALHLIEISPRLREAQERLLPGGVWHTGLESLPDAPLILLANEFLDALPVRQFVRRGAGWAERYVGSGRFVEVGCAADETPLPPEREERLGEGGTPDWQCIAGQAPSPRPSPPRAGERGMIAEGSVVEICEPALDFAAALGRRLAARPGAALLIDYGPAESTPGGSLQAIRAGRPADPLEDPGSADLTAHVDFAALARATRAAGAAVYGPVPQGLLLATLGLPQRVGRLARECAPAKAQALIDSARRLIEPDQMGRLFKAMAICSPACPVPAGFE